MSIGRQLSEISAVSIEPMTRPLHPPAGATKHGVMLRKIQSVLSFGACLKVLMALSSASRAPVSTAVRP